MKHIKANDGKMVQAEADLVQQGRMLYPQFQLVHK